MKSSIAKGPDNRSRFHASSPARFTESETITRASLESELREEIIFLREQIANLTAQYSAIQIRQISKAPNISNRTNSSKYRDDIILISYLILKFLLYPIITNELPDLSRLFNHSFKRIILST